MKNLLLIIAAGIVVSCATSKEMYTSIEEDNVTMNPTTTIESVDYQTDEFAESIQNEEPTFEEVFAPISEPEVIAIENVKEFDPLG